MAALGNSRTLLPVEYPLSSLTSWSDAAAAAAVGYSYPCTPPPVAHQFVYSGGRLAGGSHPYSCPGVGTLGVPDTSCSMYSSWRHHPSSPLSLYCQPEAEWILRPSKLGSSSHPLSHHQLQQQCWKGLQFGTAGTSADNASRDGSSGSCGAGLSPVMDAWTNSSVTTVDQYICRGQGQGLQDMRAAPTHIGIVLSACNI